MNKPENTAFIFEKHWMANQNIQYGYDRTKEYHSILLIQYWLVMRALSWIIIKLMNIIWQLIVISPAL